jgi:hypothetical protein
MGSPRGARQPLAGMAAGFNRESVWQRAFGDARPAPPARTGATVSRTSKAKARAISSAAALRKRLELANLFVPECEQAVVDLAQGVEKNRYVDGLIVVLIFQRLKPAVKKGVFHALYQIWNNTFQPEGKSFLALVGKSIIESQDLSDLVDLAFLEIFINEAISDAVDRLRINANDFLANVPIAHLIPHAAAAYTFVAGSFVFPATI